MFKMSPKLRKFAKSGHTVCQLENDLAQISYKVDYQISSLIFCSTTHGSSSCLDLPICHLFSSQSTKNFSRDYLYFTLYHLCRKYQSMVSYIRIRLKRRYLRTKYHTFKQLYFFNRFRYFYQKLVDSLYGAVHLKLKVNSY